jgi:hypothetical protein
MIECVREIEWTRRPSEKKGIDRPWTRTEHRTKK